MNLDNLLVLLVMGSLAACLTVGRKVASPLMLWLALMLFPLVIVVWQLTVAQPLSSISLLVAYITCAWLYFTLVQRGDRTVCTNELEILNPEQATAPALTKEEEAKLKGCFPWSVYYLQTIAYYDRTIVCRGQLRYTPTGRAKQHPTELAYQQIDRNIQAAFGDRFLLALRESEPNPETMEDDSERENAYFFALIPNPQTCLPQIGNKFNWLIPLILIIATAIAIFAAGLKVGGIALSLSLSSFSSLQAGLPYLLGVLAIFAARELARRFVARYYRVEMSLPYCIPFIGDLGTLGSFAWPRSPIVNRRILFDLAIAPSLAGLFAALPLLIWGLLRSPAVPSLPGSTSFLTTAFVPFDPKTSILLGTIAQAITFGKFSGNAIDMHPLALAGWLGCVVTAIGLIPIGMLEGGHLVHAIFGSRRAAMVGKLVRLLLLALALVSQPWLRVFALGLFLVDSHKQPVLNDVTDLENSRDLLGLAFLALPLVVILPVPKFLLPLLSLQ